MDKVALVLALVAVAAVAYDVLRDLVRLGRVEKDVELLRREIEDVLRRVEDIEMELGDDE